MQNSTLDLAKQERQFYNSQCIKAKEELASNPSNATFVHFSFDFAYQIHFLNSPQQVGPLYFLTPCKCQLFGVCCEAKSEQVNYLIDENDNRPPTATSKHREATSRGAWEFLSVNCPHANITSSNVPYLSSFTLF